MAERRPGGDAGRAVAAVESRIRLIRGLRVMLSSDLAGLYGVEARALVQAMKRNADRFPPDFAFQLSPAEFADLRSQTVMSSWGGARTPPYAFTEQGVAMLSSVLHSERAIRVNIEVMRTFVRLRGIVGADADLARRLADLEKRYDAQFREVFDAIRQMMAPPPGSTRKIGFIRD